MKLIAFYRAIRPLGGWLSPKLLKVMKLTAILLVVTFMQVSAKVFSQSISLNEKNAPLEKVLKSIKKQSGYLVFYQDQEMQKAIPVTIQGKNISIRQALDDCFSNQPLTYQILDRTIIVKAKTIVAVEKKAMATNLAITIKGKIVDENGKPLPGATIKVKGTNLSTVSDAAGEFSISNVQADAVLMVSFIGYTPREISVKQNLDAIKLTPVASNLSEMVVVGYGTTKKTDLTGSVSTIKKESLNDVPITRVDQMIEGQAAGVLVTAISGAPGTGSTIRIRGGNSINASNEPLYVIDGLIGLNGGNDLSLINPEDIESIVILKDASSTAIYGARGANGVIIVTTKKGKAGSDNIQVNAYTGWQKVPKFIPMLNATQYAELANESSADNGGPVLYADPQSLGAGTNWQEAISRVAPMQNYTVSSSGGSDNYRYFLSGNYINQDGVIINSGFKRYQFRANLDKDVRKNVKITTALNIGRSETKNNTVSLGGQDYSSSALAYSPAAAIYNADGTFTSKKPNDPQVYNNPVAQGILPINNTIINNITGNVGVSWMFLKGLTLKSTFGTELDFLKNNSYSPGSLPTNFNSGSGGSANVNTTNTTTIQNENTLTYDKQLGSDHHINIVAGTSYQTSNAEYLDANGSHYSTDLYQYNNLGATTSSYYGIGSNYSKFAIFSLLGRVNYTFKDKYLLTLTGREDQSSRFAENHKAAFFPAAAFAWRLGDEQFIKDLNIFSNLKLRTSFGYNGNQGISSYGSLAQLGSTTQYILGGNSILGYYNSSLANTNLKWEKTRQFDIGLEAGFFNGRINVELDYYNKLTSDLLLSEQLPLQTGFTSTLRNIGKVSNKGLELLINTTNIASKDFKWETSINIAGNRNKTVDLGGAKHFDVKDIYFGGNSSISQLVLGQPVGIFWGATYYGTLKSTTVPNGAVDPNSTHKLGDALYVDKDGDGKFGQGDFGIIGNSNPKFFGGIGNTFTYKKLSFNFYFEGTYGSQVMNIGDAFYNTGDPLTNQYATIANRWTPSNSNSDIPRVNSRQYIPSTRWVYNGSYIRLKYLNLGYTFTGRDLNAKWFNSIKIYMAATNLFLITKYPFYDPETNADGTSSILRGFDNTNYPQNRTYALGINLSL